MAFSVNDLLHAPARGTAGRWKSALARAGARNITEVNRFVDRVYEQAPRFGLDPGIIVAQAAHETGNFTSSWWINRLNPGGIGITGDPIQDAASFTWANGAAAADSMIAHLMMYTTGKNPTGFFDPRESAYREAFGNRPTVSAIKDMGRGVWAVDKDYARKIVQRGNELYPDVEAASTGEQAVALTITQQLTTRHNGRLQNAEAWITIHGNGNPSSDRFDEANFVAQGGGTSGVMYHGAIDQGGLIQIMPLDRQGIHAGNTLGNLTSIAFETCEGSEPWDKVRENTAQTIAAILLGDPRLIYGSFSKDNFSIDRICEHRDWAGANPGCPAHFIRSDGSIDARIIPRVREILKAAEESTKPPPPKKFAKRWNLPKDAENFWFNGFQYTLNAKQRRTLVQESVQFANPNLTPANIASQTKLPEGKVVTLRYVTSGVDEKGKPVLVFASATGTHIRGSNVVGKDE